MTFSSSRSVWTWLFGIGLALSFAWVAVDKAHAQVLYGSLVGAVRDTTEAAIPGAEVAITHEETGLTREGLTNAVGSYGFSNVPVGTYTVRVTMPGFREFVRTNVRVTVGTVSRSDVTLQLGEIEDVITVAAAATLLQTDTADVRTELASGELSNLPLANYRNYQSLINLVPGATPAQFQNAITDTPGRALTTNIGGTARNANMTRLDGAANVNIWLPHHTAYVPPAETIQTVNIATGSFDAEQGMAGGAAITVLTKSGTNEFSGSLFHFHDNSRVRARNFFFPHDEPMPKHLRNIAGFTLGGPIRRDRLFFFGGYEGTFERVNNSGLFTVPTPQHRLGDFSDIDTIIYDPLTGAPDGTGRQPFPGNVIPQDRLHPITQTMLSFVPEPNMDGFAANYFSSGTQAMDRHNLDLKIDWYREPNHGIWGKFSMMDADVDCDFALGEAGGPGLCAGGPGTGDTLTRLVTFGHNWTLAPNFIIDGTYGYTRMDQEVQGPDFGVNFGLDVLGIPGTNGPDIRQSGMPIFSIGGCTTLGNPNTWSPIERLEESHTFTTNFAITTGDHDLRWGFDMVRHSLDHWQPEIGGGPRGQFVFGGGVTALRDGPSPDQFNNLGTFLLGLPTEMNKSLQYELMTAREWQFAWYFRDRWQVTPNLTLNLGLRYEYYPLMTRADRGIELLDWDTLEVHLGGLCVNPLRPFDVSNQLFAPRVGLAYRIGEDTVIRSGYGITYNPMPLARPLRGFFPLTIAESFVGVDAFDPFRPIDQGIPDIVGPDLAPGVVDLPPTALMRAPGGDRINRGYIQTWNLTVERWLPYDFVGSVAYVGSSTVRQLADLNINAAGPGEGRDGQLYFEEFGRTASTLFWNGWLSSNYHSL